MRFCYSSVSGALNPCAVLIVHQYAKKLLLLVGQKKALGIAVRNDRPQRRYSGLLASLK
jgi:hypothetical protein